MKNPYSSNISAMVMLVLMAICMSPIMVDCVIIYMDTMNTIMIIFVIITAIHLFFWIVLWVMFTIIPSWKFKLRVTVNRALVGSNNSVELLYDIHHDNDEDMRGEMMLIVHHGHAAVVEDDQAKRQVMQIVAKGAMKVGKNKKDFKHSDSDSTIPSYILKPCSSSERICNMKDPGRNIPTKNLERDQASSECIYATVNKQKKNEKEKEQRKVATDADYETVA